MYFGETKKQAKIDLINQASEEEVAEMKKELKRIKLIKQEFWDEINSEVKSILPQAPIRSASSGSSQFLG